MLIPMLGYANNDIGKIFLILFNLFGALESFAFEECGQYGLFLYSDGNCYFFRPNNLTGIEDCREFDPGIHRPPNRLQGIVMEKGERSYFWSYVQQGEVTYYVKPHMSNMIQEKKCPGNFGVANMSVLLTLSELCVAFAGNETFLNGFELENVYGRRAIDRVSDAESSMFLILILIREKNSLEFFYTNNDTSKSGTITIELPRNRIKGAYFKSFQTCENESFFMIQDRRSKHIQIYVYSIPSIIKAVEQGKASYSLDPTLSLKFGSLLKFDDFSHSILVRYPYKLTAFMVSLRDEKKWYLIIPDIPYSAHIVSGCNIQDGRNGSRTAVCSESYPSYRPFPFVHSERLGVHTATKISSGPNVTFEYKSRYLQTCYLMNDCYGCHLSVLRAGGYCSWDGEKCFQSKSPKPFKKCIYLRNINENNGALEMHVEGVRLTNTGMKVHLLTAGKDRIENNYIQDHKAIFRPPESILANWTAGKIDLFLEIDNELIKNSLVRLNLPDYIRDQPYFPLIPWLVTCVLFLILIVFFSIIAMKKIKNKKSPDNREAPQSSPIDSSVKQSTP